MLVHEGYEIKTPDGIITGICHAYYEHMASRATHVQGITLDFLDKHPRICPPRVSDVCT